MEGKAEIERPVPRPGLTWTLAEAERTECSMMLAGMTSIQILGGARPGMTWTLGEAEMTEGMTLIQILGGARLKSLLLQLTFFLITVQLCLSRVQSLCSRNRMMHSTPMLLPLKLPTSLQTSLIQIRGFQIKVSTHPSIRLGARAAKQILLETFKEVRVNPTPATP